MPITEPTPFDSDWAAPDALVTINCEEFGYPQCAVQTPNSQMVEMIKTSKKEAKKMYPKVKNAIRGLDIDKIYAEQGQAWDDFCADIAICAALEFVLFKKLIPLCGAPPVNSNAPAMFH